MERQKTNVEMDNLLHKKIVPLQVRTVFKTVIFFPGENQRHISHLHSKNDSEILDHRP